jgi:hypothetical protein
MLDITGGDAAALNEVTTTLDLIAVQEDPNLTAALTLARHRDYLADRNANIPTHLPVVWATLGRHARAEALARSITDPDRQTKALTGVAEVLARAGQHQQAATLAILAETMASFITNADSQTKALVMVASALAQAGQHGQATAVMARAESVACSISGRYQRAQALTGLASVLVQAGQHGQATAVMARAEAMARSISDRYQRAQALTGLASVLVWPVCSSRRASTSRPLPSRPAPSP